MGVDPQLLSIVHGDFTAPGVIRSHKCVVWIRFVLGGTAPVVLLVVLVTPVQRGIGVKGGAFYLSPAPLQTQFTVPQEPPQKMDRAVHRGIFVPTQVNLQFHAPPQVVAIVPAPRVLPVSHVEKGFTV